jgi:hypothetical protein
MKEELATIVCSHVFKNTRSIELVVHHWDGTWQMTCGKSDHPLDCADFEVVGLNHLYERQPNLRLTAELKPGALAECMNGEWEIAFHDD